MEVSKLTGKELLHRGVSLKREITFEDLDKEYSFLLAKEIMEDAVSAGILTSDEMHNLTPKFVGIFSPYETGIFPKTP